VNEREPNRFSSVRAMLDKWRPAEPVYCIYPQVYRQVARHFLKDFPGRVLYAVKANDEAAVIRELYRGGIRHFDCASLPEIALVMENCPGAHAYFMVPVWLRGAAGAAYARYGVRHFMIDHLNALASLSQEVEMRDCVVFARMAVHHEAAMLELSSKFGARPEQIPELISAISETGAEPALAFNVGSAVTSPDAYRHAIRVAGQTLAGLPLPLRLIDIGGGYPRPYPGFAVPPLDDYFTAVAEAGAALPLAEGGEILTEPGRALAAPGLSAVVEVLLCKQDRLYINDGMYGIFWELRFKGHDNYPVRVFRDGKIFDGPKRPFRLFGPTCDSSDVLPEEVDLPREIRAGDYLEFGTIGAYSLGGRTKFNGHFSDRIVTITDPHAAPPGWNGTNQATAAVGATTVAV
jgi:ornithine decarboxylase